MDLAGRRKCDFYAVARRAVADLWFHARIVQPRRESAACPSIIGHSSTLSTLSVACKGDEFAFLSPGSTC